MTYPSEAQLIEMEQRARWFLDKSVAQAAKVKQMEARKESSVRINKKRKGSEQHEAIALDVLTLVALVRRAGGRKAAA